MSRVASEVFVAGKHVVIGGEVKSNAKLSQNDYEKIVKDALAKIGLRWKKCLYKEQALHPDDVQVQVLLNQQSPDISQGVDQNNWRNWSWRSRNYVWVCFK